jgi:hypothetical protein
VLFDISMTKHVLECDAAPAMPGTCLRFVLASCSRPSGWDPLDCLELTGQIASNRVFELKMISTLDVLIYHCRHALQTRLQASQSRL